MNKQLNLILDENDLTD